MSLFGDENCETEEFNCFWESTVVKAGEWCRLRRHRGNRLLRCWPPPQPGRWWARVSCGLEAHPIVEVGLLPSLRHKGIVHYAPQTVSSRHWNQSTSKTLNPWNQACHTNHKGLPSMWGSGADHIGINLPWRSWIQETEFVTKIKRDDQVCGDQLQITLKSIYLEDVESTKTSLSQKLWGTTKYAGIISFSFTSTHVEVLREWKTGQRTPKEMWCAHFKLGLGESS